MTIQDWKTVDISNNFMFRFVMEKKELCQGLLERVLDIKIRRIEYLSPEKNLEAVLGAKGVRLDVYIEDDQGTAYDLEMQALDKKGDPLGKRSRYYQSMMDIDALKKSQLYSNLRKSYVIFICKFDPFERDLGRYSFSNICREDKKLELEDECYKVYLNTVGKKDGLSKELQALMDFINTGIPQDEYTRKLYEEVKIQRDDERKGRAYMTYEQEMLEREEKGRKKGLQEGRKEGREEERVANIKTFVKTMRELNIEKDIVLAKLKENYQLTETEAQAYLKE